jgi:phosphohistidine phosphatase
MAVPTKKTLFLLRHAKSGWDNPTLDDFDRPLAPRGKRATKRLARHIAEQGYRFDLVLCSAAKRTTDTWDRIARNLASKTPVRHLRELYLGGEDSFVTALRDLDDDVASVVLVAHNPDIAYFAGWLCWDGDKAALRLMRAKYPTGGLAVITLDCAHWDDLDAGSGYLESFVAPRTLPDP